MRLRLPVSSVFITAAGPVAVEARRGRPFVMFSGTGNNKQGVLTPAYLLPVRIRLLILRLVFYKL